MTLGAESSNRRISLEEAIEKVESLISFLDEIARFKSSLTRGLDGSPAPYSPAFTLWLVSILDNRIAEIHHTIKVLMDPMRPETNA